MSELIDNQQYQMAAKEAPLYPPASWLFFTVTAKLTMMSRKLGEEGCSRKWQGRLCCCGT